MPTTSANCVHRLLTTWLPGLLLVFAVLLGAAPSAHAQGEPPWGNGRSRGEDLQISLLTFSPGDDIASWFGHTALLVEDNRLNQARVYNYGMFDFGPDMLAKFLMGKLEFWVGEMSLPRTLRIYESLRRDIRKQTLNLPPEKREEMAEFLAWNVRPENRDYIYDHYGDNCATRIRDAIDQAIDGQFKAQCKAPARFTLRDHTRRFSQRNPYIDLVLMTWMNDDIDQPLTEWEEMFLPTELEEQLDAATYVNAEGERVPLVAKKEILFDAPERLPAPDEPNAGWLWALLAGLVVAAVAVGLSRWYATRRSRKARVLFGLHNAAVGLVLGLPGLILPLFHLTEHKITHFNENLLLTNPILFLAAPLGLAIAFGSTRSQRWMRWAWYAMAATGLVALVIKPLPWFDQDNTMVLALLLPVHLGFALAFWLLEREPEV